MSLLNADEKLIDLLDMIELTRSPLTDIKEFETSDIGIVEGAVADEDNLKTLKDLRENCRVLVALGDCAVFGGMTSLRNLFQKEEVLERGYVTTETTVKGKVPVGEEIPKLLDSVKRVDEVVKVDYYVPGCPPSAEAILHVLLNLIEGKDPKLPPSMIHYDSYVKVRRLK
ncbi:NADP oxidoreductase [Candidatus Bathyarchaeota archaeon]|nr:MAG: NADP oxidoreductase [Candidatus Bathyarchaeota archaeon]